MTALASVSIRHVMELRAIRAVRKDGSLDHQNFIRKPCQKMTGFRKSKVERREGGGGSERRSRRETRAHRPWRDATASGLSCCVVSSAEPHPDSAVLARHGPVSLPAGRAGRAWHLQPGCVLLVPLPPPTGFATLAVTGGRGACSASEPFVLPTLLWMVWLETPPLIACWPRPTSGCHGFGVLL